jgi:hypothetical protein
MRTNVDAQKRWVALSSVAQNSRHYGFDQESWSKRGSKVILIKVLQICIFKDLFHAIVLKICKDSWGFVGFVKTGWIFWQWLDLWFHNSKRIFSSQDLWSTIKKQIPICGLRVNTNPRIHETNPQDSLYPYEPDWETPESRLSSPNLKVLFCFGFVSELLFFKITRFVSSWKDTNPVS